MSNLDNNSPGSFNAKDLTKNIVNSSDLTEQFTSELGNKVASTSETLNKNQETLTSIQEGKAKLTKATKIVSDVSKPDELSDTLVLVEELEEKMNAFSYGGVKDLEGSHITYSVVTIAGEELLKDYNFTLTINEKVADHSEFELLCPSEAFNESKKYPLANSRKLLGQKTTIQFRQFGKNTYTFVGIITSISNKRIQGYSHVVLSGHAPTILLENGEDCQSYENKNLEEIIKAATAEYTTDLLDWDIRPHLKDKLLYTVQYRESDFSFLKRLATRYGEWLYWDGEKINFGGYGGNGVDLIEEQDVFEYTLKMKLIPQKFSYIAYDAKQGKEHTVDSESIRVQDVVNPFQYDAIKASEEVYNKIPLSLYNQSLLESGAMEIREAVKRQKQNRQSSVFILEARSNNPNLRVGDVAKMHAWMPGHEIFSSGEVPLESYRVIEINHYYEGTEGYYNTFTGVPVDNFTPPYMDEDAIPECEEQSARVTDNNDPQGMSRIRVQFPWQKPSGGQSPWLRVATPYAGEGKGMHVIPEIGEEVIVSFENGNAEKPVVLGSMFNGKGKSGHGGAGNYMKGLATASGSSLMFNDQSGSMNLADKGGASMNFDGAGNATIKAVAMSHTCVGEDASVLKMDADGNITLKGKTNITFEIEGGSKITMTKTEIKLESENIKIVGSSTTEVGKAGAAQGMLVTNGGRTYINGSSEVVIKGGKVDIN